MRTTRNWTAICLAKALLLNVCVIALPTATAKEPADLHLDVLKAGTQVYSNVTVTTRAEDYVFVKHDHGLSSIKVTDLDAVTREALGYVAEKQAGTGATADWARKEFAKLEPAGTNFARMLPPQISSRLPTRWSLPQNVGMGILGGVALIILACHFFFSYCALRICKNAGTLPDFLIWLPVFQWLPMLSAAGMSRWWSLGCLVPLLNVVVVVMWSIKIAQVCGKSTVTGILLILPVTNVFAFLYLAFSAGKPKDPAPKRTRSNEIMTLETA